MTAIILFLLSLFLVVFFFWKKPQKSIRSFVLGASMATVLSLMAVVIPLEMGALVNLLLLLWLTFHFWLFGKFDQ